MRGRGVKHLKAALKNEASDAAKRVGAQLVRQHVFSKFLPKSWYSTYTPKQLLKGEFRSAVNKIKKNPFGVAQRGYELLKKGGGRRRRRRRRR